MSALLSRGQGFLCFFSWCVFVCVGREGEALPDLTTLNNSLTITNQQPINGTTNII